MCFRKRMKLHRIDCQPKSYGMKASGLRIAGSRDVPLRLLASVTFLRILARLDERRVGRVLLGRRHVRSRRRGGLRPRSGLLELAQAGTASCVRSRDSRPGGVDLGGVVGLRQCCIDGSWRFRSSEIASLSFVTYPSNSSICISTRRVMENIPCIAGSN